MSNIKCNINENVSYNEIVMYYLHNDYEKRTLLIQELSIHIEYLYDIYLITTDDRKKAINEMYRVTKHDGLVFIEVWNEINDKWKSTTKNKTYIRYYKHYTQEELANEIINFCPNFQIIEQGYEKENWFIILKKS